MADWTFGTTSFVSYGDSDWAVATSEIPIRSPSIWYGVPLPDYKTVRIRVRCGHCDVLQVPGKVKCPYCGAPYNEYIRE